MKKYFNNSKQIAIAMTIVTLSFPFFTTTISATTPNDSILNVLNIEMDKAESYYATHENMINTLREQLSEETNKKMQLGITNKLFDEFIIWQYDSAFVYTNNAEKLAIELGDDSLKIKAQLNRIRCFISSGYFKEGAELINSINPQEIPNELRGEYYKLAMEYYDALSIYYDNSYYSPIYRRKAVEYFDKAKMYFEPETVEYTKLVAYAYRLTDVSNKEKIQKYCNLLDTYIFSDRDLAYISSLMSVLYTADQDNEKAIYYASLSAISDIRAAIRQTTSKILLGQNLYKEGNILFASKCIKSALDDANFYNARQRMMEINSILPIIEYEKINLINQQNERLHIYLVILSILVMSLILAMLIIYKQIGELKKARKSIQKQYVDLLEVNKELDESNDIKDTYIIQSLYGKSEQIEQIEQLLKKIDRKVSTRQYDDLRSVCRDYNTKTERENMYSSFDSAFSMLFPNFENDFNNLFNKEDETILGNNKSLNPELRIFALMRLGISDSERISKFLNVNIKTIYAYKSKVRAKTIVPKEEFEERIMAIKRRKNKN